MIPLSHLLDAAEQVDRPVAFGREGTRSFFELRRDVAALAARLAPAKGEALLVHCEDAYAFAVALFAAARVGARALLPPSRQPGVLARLASEVWGALVDAPRPPEALAAGRCWHPLAAGSLDTLPLEPRPLDREAPLATLFTSGTTGDGARVEKALRHLEDEVEVLEQSFGAQLGAGTSILASVAPQHLYGLLFRVLWPLAAGRPFLRTAALHPEELAPQIDAAAPFALVTTPATLRRWAGRDSLARLAQTCRAVFSSGGPLAADVARSAADSLGGAPWEIYGSTETGGVAVRRQERGGEPWRALPGVAVSEDSETGCLVVESRFVSAGEVTSAGRARFATGDRAVFHGADGGFELRGRADRVVKVGEKRLALADMEARLLAHPAVSEAALFPLPGAAGETRVGAVVVPTQAARDALSDDGRRALGKRLGEHLASDFERVLLPRAWRFVAELPRDAQGKLPLASLRALFEDEARPAAARAESARAEQTDEALDVPLHIPSDLAFLDGHYPSFPIVAGVVQVHFAMSALQELLGEPVALAQLEALKFHELLLPGQQAVLRVRLDRAAARFRFSLEDAARAERAFSSGRGRLRQVSRSPQDREAVAQRGEAERSVGPREGSKAREDHRE